MASKKVTKILKSKTDFSDNKISEMTDAEGWKLVYSLNSKKTFVNKKENQICFTGFSVTKKNELQFIAQNKGFDVVSSVTKSLTYLCCGSNAGPVKIANAQKQGVIIFDESQFYNLIETGELPSQNLNRKKD